MVLLEVNKCIKNKREYTGVTVRGGRKLIITHTSQEDTIITDWVEQGLRFWWTMMMANHRHLEEELLVMGRNDRMSALHCMQPVITRIQERSLGKKNSEKWQLARFRQTKQMNRMLGKIKLHTLQEV